MVINIDMTKLFRLKLTAGEYALLCLLAERKVLLAKQYVENDSSITSLTIHNLIERKLIHATEQENGVDVTKIIVRNIFLDEIKKGDLFDELLAHYPIKVTRPDGTVDYLRNDLTRCRKLYNQLIKSGEVIHTEVMQCLAYEVYDRTSSNKMGYMKKLHKWLTSEEWQTWKQKLDEVEIIGYNELGYGLKLE
jgi:hypothetical protein